MTARWPVMTAKSHLLKIPDFELPYSAYRDDQISKMSICSAHALEKLSRKMPKPSEFQYLPSRPSYGHFPEIPIFAYTLQSKPMKDTFFAKTHKTHPRASHKEYL